MQQRTQGSAANVGSGSGATDDVDAAVEAAIKRRRATLKEAADTADARDKAAGQEVAASNQGTKKQRDDIVKAMHDGWQDGHSPQANAIFDGEAKAEMDLRRKIADAKKRPPAEIKPAIDKAIEDFPGEADKATEEARAAATEDQVTKLLKAAAPLAAFAGCLAIGGGPICGAVAAFIAKLFGANPGTEYSKQIGALLGDSDKILSGSCDLECLLHLVGGGTTIPSDSAITDLFKGISGDGRDYEKWKDVVTKGARGLSGFIECAKDVKVPAQDLTSSKKCEKAFKSVGLTGHLETYLPKIEKCVQTDDKRQAICFRAKLL